MSQRSRHLLSLSAIALATLLSSGTFTEALAQTRQVLTFAGVTFSEAGRGDRLKAWVEKFNKSQDKIEVQPVALPFATLANTIFTQMGGGAGPDLVRFDQIDFYAAVAANRILPFEANDQRERLQVHRARPISEGRRQALWHTVRDQQLRSSLQQDAGEGRQGARQLRRVPRRPRRRRPATAFMASPIAPRWRSGRASGRTSAISSMASAAAGATSRQPDASTARRWSKASPPTRRCTMLRRHPKGTDAATYRRMFWENKLAMEIDNGGVAGIFYQQAPDLPLAAAPSPFPTRAQGLILAPLTVNANTKHKDAAFTFVNGRCSRRTRRICRIFSARATSRPSWSARRKFWPSSLAQGL